MISNRMPLNSRGAQPDGKTEQLMVRLATSRWSQFVLLSVWVSVLMLLFVRLSGL